MKKIFALILALVMVCALAACGAAEAPAGIPAEAPAAAGDLKAGVFYYDYADTFLSDVRTALDAALSAAGIQYTNYDAANDQAAQSRQIQQALADGCNLLVVNLVTSGSSAEAKAILDAANGVPVVFFNRAVERENEEGVILSAYDNVCYIGTDPTEAGSLQGKIIGEYLTANFSDVDLNGDGTITYAMFKGDEANVEATNRTRYSISEANSILTASGKAELVYFDASNIVGYQVDMNGAWSAEAAREYMTANLAQFSEANGNMIELVICNNDTMAEGCIAALEAAGYNNGEGKTIPVFGVDATAAAQELIKAGKMTGTVKQDAEAMANAIASVVASMSNGTAAADSVAAVAAQANSNLYTVAEGYANKLYVGYAPYTA